MEKRITTISITFYEVLEEKTPWGKKIQVPCGMEKREKKEGEGGFCLNFCFRGEEKRRTPPGEKEDTCPQFCVSVETTKFRLGPEVKHERRKKGPILTNLYVFMGKRN